MHYSIVIYNGNNQLTQKERKYPKPTENVRIGNAYTAKSRTQAHSPKRILQLLVHRVYLPLKEVVENESQDDSFMSRYPSEYSDAPRILHSPSVRESNADLENSELICKSSIAKEDF